jgi:hypothetical protein
VPGPSGFTEMIADLVADRLRGGFEDDSDIIEVEQVGDRIFLHCRPELGRIVEVEFHERRVSNPGGGFHSPRGH